MLLSLFLFIFTGCLEVVLAQSDKNGCPNFHPSSCLEILKDKDRSQYPCNDDQDCGKRYKCCNNCRYSYKVCTEVEYIYDNVEYLKNKRCPVTKPCYVPICYNLKYRCRSDLSCPFGYKCCKNGCYSHRVCVLPVDNEEKAVPAPSTTTTTTLANRSVFNETITSSVVVPDTTTSETATVYIKEETTITQETSTSTETATPTETVTKNKNKTAFATQESTATTTTATISEETNPATEPSSTTIEESTTTYEKVTSRYTNTTNSDMSSTNSITENVSITTEDVFSGSGDFTDEDDEDMFSTFSSTLKTFTKPAEPSPSSTLPETEEWTFDNDNDTVSNSPKVKLTTDVEPITISEGLGDFSTDVQYFDKNHSSTIVKDATVSLKSTTELVDLTSITVIPESTVDVNSTLTMLQSSTASSSVKLTTKIVLQNNNTTTERTIDGSGDGITNDDEDYFLEEDVEEITSSSKAASVTITTMKREPDSSKASSTVTISKTTTTESQNLSTNSALTTQEKIFIKNSSATTTTSEFLSSSTTPTSITSTSLSSPSSVSVSSLTKAAPETTLEGSGEGLTSDDEDYNFENQTSHTPQVSTSTVKFSSTASSLHTTKSSQTQENDDEIIKSSISVTSPRTTSAQNPEITTLQAVTNLKESEDGLVFEEDNNTVIVDKEAPAPVSIASTKIFIASTEATIDNNFKRTTKILNNKERPDEIKELNSSSYVGGKETNTQHVTTKTLKEIDNFNQTVSSTLAVPSKSNDFSKKPDATISLLSETTTSVPTPKSTLFSSSTTKEDEKIAQSRKALALLKEASGDDDEEDDEDEDDGEDLI